MKIINYESVNKIDEAIEEESEQEVPSEDLNSEKNVESSLIKSNKDME